MAVKPAAPPHAGLEARLLQTAAQIIARDGVEALSMRTLGSAAGVSRTAAYYYFPDKAALVARVGADGFERMAARIRAAGLAAPPGIEQIIAGFTAYLEFAVAEPDLYRVMFSGVLARPLTLPATGSGEADQFSSTGAHDAFRLMVESIGATWGGTEAETLMRANIAWSFTHGVATLAMGNHLKLVDRQAVLDQGLRRLLGASAG
jgi:AcrR family transcriptional regulator